MENKPKKGRPQRFTDDDILRIVIEYKRQHDGISPSLDEIGAVLGASKNLVWRHLISLYSAQRVTWSVDKPRTIEVVGGRWTMEA